MTSVGSPTYDALVDRVRALVAALSRPPVVGIAGHGGAGKTTLARRLARDLGFVAAQVVKTDRLYAATDTRRAGLFELQDWPVVLDLLRRVRSEPVPERLRYATRGYDGDEGEVDLPMPPVVVIEGIRVIRPETLPLLDLAVWLDLDPETAGQRAKARNVQQGDSRREVDLWDTKWVPEGREYQRLVRPELLAHVVLPADETPLV
ncbi:AAA family ATPase [Nocardioides sp.]|uniref:AAA family ATPase n=1 Tax=Nocardioides sp. TaxID=35761 RepID=UPI002ED0C178